MSLTDDTHALIESHFMGSHKLLAVDATCGNGNDTAFLMNLGFDNVFGFDIQAQAIQATHQRLGDNDSLTLIQDSHAHLNSHITQPIDCLMFNLGYLPTGNKDLTTSATSSLKALESGLALLSPQGLITIMCYPGHPSGALETQAIRGWLGNLESDKWIIETHLAASPKPAAPILYVIKRENY